MARSIQGNKMECQEDKLMAASLACLQELRRNVHDIAERIAEQVSETEEHLQHYVQFELIKAAVCLKNVSEKLAVYAEKQGHAGRDNHPKPRDILVKGEKVPVVSFVPAWTENSLANTESFTEFMSEPSDMHPSSIRQHTDQHKQTQVSTDLDRNSPSLIGPKFQSKIDDPPYKWRSRSVFMEGLNRSTKVRGNSLPSKCTDVAHAPSRYFHWKQQTQKVPSHVPSGETAPRGRSSPFENTVRERDKGSPLKCSIDSQDWMGERRNHLQPDTREAVMARRRSPSPNCRHSDIYGGSPRYSTERQGQGTWHQQRHSRTPPQEVHAGRPCSHSEYRLPLIGTILPHYDSVQTRNMKKRQDHNMRQLFGL